MDPPINGRRSVEFGQPALWAATVLTYCLWITKSMSAQQYDDKNFLCKTTTPTSAWFRYSSNYRDNNDSLELNFFSLLNEKSLIKSKKNIPFPDSVILLKSSCRRIHLVILFVDLGKIKAHARFPNFVFAHFMFSYIYRSSSLFFSV